MTYTALVVGGGIAGTSVAIALRKAGITPVVCEAYDRTADNAGAFLTLAVNALDALQALDLDIDGLGFDTPKIRITNGSGRRLGELPYGTGGTTGHGLVSRTVKRADLYRFLRDHAVRRGVPIEYGRRLIDATSTRDGVRATFADGGTAEADLLIGADGLRSQVRRIIDPAAPAARYTGLLNTGGYVRGVATDAEPGLMHAVFGKRCFFVFTRHPDGEVWWAANPAQPTEPSPAQIAAITTDEWRTRLTTAFAGDRSLAWDIVAATPRIFSGWITYTMPAVPAWHRDRMIIIGDAAHATAPSIGQGAAMAIEDAVVLARCLRDAPDIEAAFSGYERLRRHRVERVVKQGERTGDWKALSPLARLPRDLIMTLAMRHATRTGTYPQNDWLYDHHLDWGTVTAG
ncbi:FAD-dependent monooxygenase [Spongiactinospora rosea]|uniref:FAD-dependent monooxygenase n=1 Tax=Spongiactinospora rosea TaxID=2248750 RepID=A0A366M4B3_9ACTN|nr:FAD-dependent monooxygenase [Spongiactinospora rosea]RBQ21021.1 FAD-dependent monooxygenase [Spongiactinospora rosea]